MVFIPRWERYKNKKPSGPVEINWNSWFSNNLILASHGFERELISSFDINRNGSLIINNNDLLHDNVADYTELEQTNDTIIPTSEITIALGYQKSDGTNRVSGAFGFDDLAASTRCGAHIPYSNGTVYFDFGGAVTGRVYKSGLTLGDDDWVFSSSIKNNLLYIAQNGVVVATAANALTRARTSYKFSLGKHAGVLSDLAEYKYIWIYDRQLNAEEVAAISEYPYQVVKPKPTFYIISGTSNPVLEVSSETDSSFSFNIIKNYSINVSNETDSSFTISPQKIVSIYVAQETDTSTAFTITKNSNIGQSSETDTGIALNKVSITSISQSTETDSSFAVSSIKNIQLGLSTETDSSFNLTVGSQTIVSLITAIESSVAVGLIGRKETSILSSITNEIANSIVISKYTNIVNAGELSSSNSLVFYKNTQIVSAIETDTSFALGINNSQNIPISTAIENSVSNTLSIIKNSSITFAQETDSAFSVSQLTGIPILTAIENNTSNSLNIIKNTSINTSTETNISFGIYNSLLGTAYETSSSNGIVSYKNVPIIKANEISQSIGITGYKINHLQYAVETDNALPLTNPADQTVVYRKYILNVGKYNGTIDINGQYATLNIE